MKRLTKLRFVLVYPMVVVLFLVARTTERQLHLGILFIALGMYVRFWANGYVGHRKVNQTAVSRGEPKIGTLITGGPYAYVRHPLYVGSFLLGLGFCVIVGHLLFGVVALGGLFVVYQRKMAQEEAVLLHEWGDKYLRYYRHVPRLIPTWRRAPERRGRWSWQGVAASQELRTLVWVTVLVIALYFREELVQHREPLFYKHGLKQAVLLAVLAALMVGDGLFELVRRWRRRSVRLAASTPAAS